MARAIEILVNEAMKIERNEALGAQPYERTDERRGYANAPVTRKHCKPKTLQTRVGKVELQVPQTRDVEFYPKSLERGVRRTGPQVGRFLSGQCQRSSGEYLASFLAMATCLGDEDLRDSQTTKAGRDGCVPAAQSPSAPAGG